VIVTGEFAVDERGVPGRYGRTSGGESESTTSIRYCGEWLSHATPGQETGVPHLVKEVIPGNDIQNVCPFGYIWSMEVFVNAVSGDQRFV
jgi:hypothetical protein